MDRMIYSRNIEANIKNLMFRGKALVIVGARQVGKTTMLQNIVKDKPKVLWLNADESIVRERLKEKSVISLSNIIGSYKIVIIDEVQRIENAGLLLKIMVDHFKDVQFIATGSSSLEISETIFEPITGRYFLFHLYPFGISELYEGSSAFEIERELGFHLVFGNYPEIHLKRDIAETILRNLSDQYLYKDVLVWKDIRKPELLQNILKLLAYQIGSEVSFHELALKLQVKSETIQNYIDLLEKSFVIYRLKSYNTNQRKEVSKMSKIFFYDNGIRNAIIENFDDLSIRNDHGQLFENFIISEMLKRNSWINPAVKSYFWRNYDQREVDYIEVYRDKISAYEIKWNTKKKHKISRSFTNLYPNAKTEIITPQNLYSFLI